jgi:plasmid stabilization system protein ParE
MIVWAPEAIQDLVATVDFIALRNPTAAAALAERVFELVDHLAAGDFDGSEQQLTSGEHVRSWAVPPLRVYYQRQPAGLHVVRVYHQARFPITK